MAGFPVRQPLRRHRPVSGLISDMHFVYCASGLSFGRIRFRITANIVASTTGDDANVLLIMDWKLSRLMLMLSASWMLAVIWFKQPSLKDTPIPMAMDSPATVVFL